MDRRQTCSADDVRTLALALPEAVESSHMGIPDIRVRKKNFRKLPPGAPHTVNLKTTPITLDALVQFDPDTFRDAWGQRWVGVELRGVTREHVRELVVDAWRLVAPKRLAATFDRGDV